MLAACILWSVYLWVAWLPWALAGPAEDAAVRYDFGDYGKAREIWQDLATQGNAEAQYHLGLLYERGEGVPKNERAAAAWYSMAAAAQQVDAQARLGQIYRDGTGVRKNATRAVLLLYGAAMEGHEQAMKDLAALAPHRGKNSVRAVLYGVNLAETTRETMRAAIAQSGVLPVREDAAYICDVYDVRKTVPGATEMAACYGTVENGAQQPLGFVKIDYDAADKTQAERIRSMVSGRFGAPAAGEGTHAWLWNLGDVIVATQYTPEMHQVGLMYMVPKVYHMTRETITTPHKK